MKTRSIVLASLALLLLVVATPEAASAAPVGTRPMIGPCSGSGAGGFYIDISPPLMNAFPGATALSLIFATTGHAVVWDDIGALAKIDSDLTFLAQNDDQVVLWQATAKLRVRGFAREAPLPDVDNAQYPRTLTVTMRPVGFQAPAVRLSWPLVVVLSWYGGAISSCGVAGGDDIPTVIN